MPAAEVRWKKRPRAAVRPRKPGAGSGGPARFLPAARLPNGPSAGARPVAGVVGIRCPKSPNRNTGRFVANPVPAGQANPGRPAPPHGSRNRSTSWAQRPGSREPRFAEWRRRHLAHRQRSEPYQSDPPKAGGQRALLGGPGAPQKIPRNLQKPEGATGGLRRPAAPSFQFFTRFSLGTLRDTELRLQCPFFGPSHKQPVRAGVVPPARRCCRAARVMMWTNPSDGLAVYLRPLGATRGARLHSANQ